MLQERLKLLPSLIHDLSSNFRESLTSGAILLNIFFKILRDLNLPARGTKEDLQLRELFGYENQEAEGKFLASWLGKLILFGIGSSTSLRYPGLSLEESKVFQLHGKEDAWNSNSDGGLHLGETKIIACKFLASGAFTDPERFTPAIFMSADQNSRISDIGEDILKRAINSVSLEDANLVRDLLRICIGTRGAEGSLPVRPTLQRKILGILCKSKAVSFFTKESMQIVQETLAPTESSQTDGTSLNMFRGLEASKLRQQVFSFANWLTRISDAKTMASVAPRLVANLQDYIETQGWPRPRTDEVPTAGDLTSRAYGYESIGLLASACPKELVREPNLHLLRWLFTSLSEDSSGRDVSISIEQALGNVLGSFSNELDSDFETALVSLLSHHMSMGAKEVEESSSIIRSTRFVAVRFANRCLPFHNVDARWIDLLAISGPMNEGHEVAEEGKRGLDPYWYQTFEASKTLIGEDTMGSGHSLPAFSALVSRLYGPDAGWDFSKMDRPSISHAYTYGLTFCRNVLFHQLLESLNQKPIMDNNWEHNITSGLTISKEIRLELSNHFRRALESGNGNADALKRFLWASLNGLTHLKGREAGVSGDLLIELCSLMPDGFYAELSEQTHPLKKSIVSTDVALQEQAAHIFGLFASLADNPESSYGNLSNQLISQVQDWAGAVGGGILKINGAILAISFFLSRTSHRRKSSIGIENLQKIFVTTILELLDKCRDKLLIDASLTAISQMSLFGALTPVVLAKPYNADALISKIAKQCKDGSEKAVVALGHLSLQCIEDESECSNLTKIIQELRELHTVRQPETQFAVGAALTCAAVGWQSTSLISSNDILSSAPAAAPRKATLSQVLERILQDCKTTKPALRQASVIWLLCILQFCGDQPEVKGKLKECQAAFKGFLSDRESLNQESASRGLGLVYQNGDRALKDDLVKDLIGSFIGNTSGLAGSVSADTQLFDAGTLPTGDGSITTYKDIMSLASEVGDTSLVYRFMSLASNNAIWSSRAAFGRFGLNNVFGEADTERLLAQNPKLYSALFRYRFDPNTNVRAAMNDIWNALVKEPTKIVNKYFDKIVQDLLKSMIDREWRTRQASCVAMADLIQGRPLQMYEVYLNEIWAITFKVCDDIKESVRSAAMALARVLTGILTREFEAGSGASRDGEKMLRQVLPFLLSPSGLESSAPDVQEFARTALLEIIRKSNEQTLRPFAPELVQRLLALLSSIEPELINYLHLNADKYGITTEQLDDARLKHIKGSSLLEAIERCLDTLDESSMPEFKGHLETAIKTVIGLPSKVGCSRVLVSLSTRRSFIFRPYADSFLLLARKQVSDRNDTISSSYAAACGYLARLASSDALVLLLKYCRELYFDSEDDRQRVMSGEIIYALSKHATDRFHSLAADVLPFVFVAKHDANERAKLLFEKTWNENVGGSRAVLLYLKEIMHLASVYLDSSRWSLKHTSSYAIAESIISAGTSIELHTAKVMWPSLEKALSGKTWDGKEILLKAFIHLAKHSPLLQTDKQTGLIMAKIMARESKRNNPAYREYALASLGDFVELRVDVDSYDEVRSIADPLVEELSGDSDDMDIDAVSGHSSSRSVGAATLENSIRALLKGINPHQRSGEGLCDALRHTLKVLRRTDQSQLAARTLRSRIYPEIERLFDKLKEVGGATWNESAKQTLMAYGDLILAAGDDVEQSRLEAAKAAIAFARVARNAGEDTSTAFWNGLTKATEVERSSSVRQRLEQALGVVSTTS